MINLTILIYFYIKENQSHDITLLRELIIFVGKSWNVKSYLRMQHLVYIINTLSNLWKKGSLLGNLGISNPIYKFIQNPLSMNLNGLRTKIGLEGKYTTENMQFKIYLK